MRHGTAVDDVLRNATQKFLDHPGGDPATLHTAAASLAELPPPGAACLAVTLGTLAERDGTATATGPLLLDQFRAWLRVLPARGQQDAEAPMSEPTAEQGALLEVFPELCQSVVAHVARMPAERRALGEDQDLLDRLEELEEYGPGATWVREALLKTSGTIVALYPQSEKAVRLKYENVSNCFHLFSLLQAAIGRRLPSGRTPDPRLVAVAKGITSASLSDEAWWHYGHARSVTPDISASIWGEASPRSIPMFDDVQVLLLWPPLLSSRSWDSGFFQPHLEALPADVRLESELSTGDARSWLDRLGVDASKKKWWKRRSRT
jgi:hypothetical protein